MIFEAGIRCVDAFSIFDNGLAVGEEASYSRSAASKQTASELLKADLAEPVWKENGGITATWSRGYRNKYRN